MIYNSKSCSLSSSTFGSSLFITKPHKYCGIFSVFRGGSVLWSLTPLFSCIGEWLLYVMSPPSSLHSKGSFAVPFHPVPGWKYDRQWCDKNRTNRGMWD